MFSRFEIMVAFRYLRARRKEGFISIIALFSFLGIMIGVATLIIVMSVMNGFRSDLMDRILGINAHISVSGYKENIENYNNLLEKFISIPYVTRATPIVNGQVLATANGKHTGSQIRGMTFSDLKKKNMISDNIVLGDIINFNNENAIIIGSRMSRSMSVLPGDTIQLISPDTTETFFGAMPRMKDYTVAAIFDVGMIEYDSSIIFMPMKAAQIYFRMNDSVSSIEIMTESHEKISEVVKAIYKSTKGKYHILDWKEANSHFLDSLKTERSVMFLILTLIIIVAAFNIISGMVMLVSNKGREIAILRTIGATRGSIMRIFLMCGASIGFIGTLCGFLLGISFAINIEEIRRWLEGFTNTELFSAEIYFLSKLPADIHAQDVINVVIMALVLSLLATLYPAWRAARISPIDGLRYE